MTRLDLNKNIILDIANIKKLTTATMCADTTNCCDRAVHPFASLCAQYFGLDVTFLLVLFETTQMMKMCLRTTFGMSHMFYNGEEGQPF